MQKRDFSFLSDDFYNEKKESFFTKESINKFKIKVKKNFFVGFGFGLMVASIAFWIFGGNDTKDVVSLESKYTDAKLIERAKELGMIFPNEQISGEEIND